MRGASVCAPRSSHCPRLFVFSARRSLATCLPPRPFEEGFFASLCCSPCPKPPAPQRGGLRPLKGANKEAGTQPARDGEHRRTGWGEEQDWVVGEGWISRQKSKQNKRHTVEEKCESEPRRSLREIFIQVEAPHKLYRRFLMRKAVSLARAFPHRPQPPCPGTGQRPDHARCHARRPPREDGTDRSREMAPTWGGGETERSHGGARSGLAASLSSGQASARPAIRYNGQPASVRGGCGFYIALEPSASVQNSGLPLSALTVAPRGCKVSGRENPSAVSECLVPTCPGGTLRCPAYTLLPVGPPLCLGVRSSPQFALPCRGSPAKEGEQPLGHRRGGTQPAPATKSRATARGGFAAQVCSQVQEPPPAHPGSRGDSSRHKPHGPTLIYVQDRRQVPPRA